MGNYLPRLPRLRLLKFGKCEQSPCNFPQPFIAATPSLRSGGKCCITWVLQKFLDEMTTMFNSSRVGHAFARHPVLSTSVIWVTQSRVSVQRVAGVDSMSRSQRQAAYQEFLSSDFWLHLRARRIKKDGCKCAKCPKTTNLQVHHKKYPKRWEDTRLRHLITLCESCHEIAHGFKSPPSKKKAKQSSVEKWAWAVMNSRQPLLPVPPYDGAIESARSRGLLSWTRFRKLQQQYPRFR